MISSWLYSPHVTFAFLFLTTTLSVTSIYTNAVLVRAEGNDEKLQTLYHWCATVIIPLFALIPFVIAIAWLFYKERDFSIFAIALAPLITVSLYTAFYVPLYYLNPRMPKVTFSDKLSIKILRFSDTDRAVIVGRTIWTIPSIVYLLLLGVEQYGHMLRHQ